jgi:hypothetical protein
MPGFLKITHAAAENIIELLRIMRKGFFAISLKRRNPKACKINI